MASKDREARKEQKLYWDNQLSQRLKVLTEKGLEPGRIAKDPIVKKIRAKLRKTETRLKAIDAIAKKNEEMMEAKAAKAEAEAKASAAGPPPAHEVRYPPRGDLRSGSCARGDGASPQGGGDHRLSGP